jgi:diacylglycerol kinase family enzyme
VGVIPAFVNASAGSAAGVDDALRKASCFDVRACAAHDVRKSVRAAVKAGATRVAVVGGDGTISAAAAALVGTDVELVVIPAGTFNHFARDNGIPTDLDEACAVAHSTQVIRADVGRVNGRVFLNTSSVGVYANYVRFRELHEPRFGYWLSSMYAAARALTRVRPFRLRFEAGLTRRPYVTPLVFIGLGERELKLPKLGGRVENGKQGLHVMIVNGRRRARLVALSFAAAARGVRAVSRTPHLDSFIVDRCTIEQRHSTVALDGEVVTLRSPLEYELLRGALRLVVP